MWPRRVNKEMTEDFLPEERDHCNNNPQSELPLVAAERPVALARSIYHHTSLR